MIKSLTEETKKTVSEIIFNLVDETITEFGLGFKPEPCDEIPQKFFENAVECFKDNFEMLEHDYEILGEYYNDNGEIPNLPRLKHLCCKYAETLI